MVRNENAKKDAGWASDLQLFPLENQRSPNAREFYFAHEIYRFEYHKGKILKGNLNRKMSEIVLAFRTHTHRAGTKRNISHAIIMINSINVSV